MILTEVDEKIKTHIPFSAPFSQNRALYEVMSKKHGGVKEAADSKPHARFMLGK